MKKKILTLPVFLLALALGGAAQADGDPASGFKVFKKCGACHKIKPGQPSQVGPNLHGLFGREAGTGDFGRYSEAMKASDVVWTEETLAAWLRDPRGFIPGNKMAFPGLKKEEDVRDLIAFLKRATR
ncbi:c-type cytochrome [Minwuia thermotolerans]|uniref:Cytochrome c family protein n=1 Tax=Minwuia thermotolerans TaxID=2056226 RepID=A0A2M9G5A4_9PROT|nr:cytochrome c family protein [Minwuia thermotolerans]PJK30893.1 cytochrome c family protein [Minwuia thermotolerans]